MFLSYIIDCAYGDQLDFIGQTLNNYCQTEAFKRKSSFVSSKEKSLDSEVGDFQLETDIVYRSRLQNAVGLLK
jgi:hypothetical protein